MAEAVITVNGLTRHFDGVVAVDGLTLDVYPGEVFGFLGHNGAGKTTTVRLLNGVLTPTAGQARLLGLDPAKDGPALRRRTGVLTETPSLEERLTAYENLTIYAELYDVPVDDVNRRARAMLEMFDLAGRAGEKVGAYSRGMKQRLALARALLHDPELLFLDEPTAGLDPAATRQVHGLIQQLSQERGRTVFLCTHNLVEAQKLCDRVAVLEHGRLMALGTPAALARQVASTARLDVEVDHHSLQIAEQIVRSLPGVQDVNVNKQMEANVAVQGIVRERIPDLVRALTNAGVAIYRVSPKEPSLEDVYFAFQSSSNLDIEERAVGDAQGRDRGS